MSSVPPQEGSPDAASTSPAPLLSGRVALVTGGGRGIGLATARALGAHGARLILNDAGTDPDGRGRDPSVVEAAAAELRAQGYEVVKSAHDVTSPSEVAELVALAENYGDPIDLLVNAHGALRKKTLLDLEPDDLESAFRTDALGTLLTMQAVARELRKRKRSGSIVNMTSVSGLLGTQGQTAEATSKAAVYGLTRTAAIELQRFGITVNAVAAIARTRLTEDLPMFEKVHGTMEPEHVAPAVVFLASSLSEGLSGAILSVAGGRISTIALTESQGRLKDEAGGIWTASEIQEHFASISRR